MFPNSPPKNSFWLRAVKIRQLCVANSRRICRSMPTIRLLELTNFATLSPTKQFLGGLLTDELKRG